MTGPQLPDVDHGLHDALEKLTRQHGAMDLDWLAVRARKELRDARVNPDTIGRRTALYLLAVAYWYREREATEDQERRTGGSPPEASLVGAS